MTNYVYNVTVSHLPDSHLKNMILFNYTYCDPALNISYVERDTKTNFFYPEKLRRVELERDFGLIRHAVFP